MNHLGIDVRTSDCRKLISRLAALRTTKSIQNAGPYREDLAYSQLHITTEMTQEQLDGWLYNVKHGADYVGVFRL